MAGNAGLPTLLRLLNSRRTLTFVSGRNSIECRFRPPGRRDHAMSDELAGKTILLVDDDKDIRASMKAALEDMGPNILVAPDGNEAVRLAEEAEPDLIVLDMMLPKRSGFLVMEKLRSRKRSSGLPKVIMITANRGTRHKVYAEGLGVDEYLNKPFPMERLVESVESLLR